MTGKSTNIWIEKLNTLIHVVWKRGLPATIVLKTTKSNYNGHKIKVFIHGIATRF